MPVHLDMSGWDDFNRKHQKAIAQTELSFTELFPGKFVSNNTDFHSLQEMLDASGLDKPEELQGEVWSRFVTDHSRFSGWAEMQTAAYAEWYKTQVSL